MECANCRAGIPAGGDNCPRCGWQVPAERLHFAKWNAVFAGRYDFLRLLGSGGFAEVFLARDALLEREVAIKILLPQHAQDPQTVERFLREARLYAKLEHRNIIPIYDTGILQGHVFITMKYIRGESLKHALSRDQRIDPRRVPLIARDVAQALAYIHRQGIVHRDIKPANIIVEQSSQTAYLADFGIARAESSQTLTQTGMVVGTPHYLSPEQIQGKKSDQRSDIYALGASLYEMVSGQPPFRGDSPLEILYQHINESPESLSKLVPDIDPVIERLINKCIAKDPSRRFQGAEEIVALIDRTEASRSVAAKKTVALGSAPGRPRKTARPLLIAALIASLAVAAYFFWPRGPQSAPERRIEAASPSGGGDRGPPHPQPETRARSEQGTVNDPEKQPEPVARPPGENVPDERQAASGRRDQESAPAATGARKETAAPLPGTIRFSSFPPLAEVMLGGARIGNTEQLFEKKFAPGAYTFTFSIPGYQSVPVTVTLAPGETATAHHRFPPFRNFTITARPFGRVFIDGREYGDTPQQVKLAYGEHLVRVTKDGYRSAEHKVLIDQTAKNSVHFELQKEGTK